MRNTMQESIVIGADHAGYPLKEALKRYLTEQGIQPHDVGCFDETRTDYPGIAAAAIQALSSRQASQAILCCGSGIGMAITANRCQGVRAVVAADPYTAELSRRHNNTNVLCLGGRTIAPALAEKILQVWLATSFEGGRHADRLQQIETLSVSRTVSVENARENEELRSC